MENSQYRGLIIQNNPFSYKTGNGKTLAAMFTLWDSADLAQIFTSNLQPDFSICKQYYKISDAAAVKSFMTKCVIGAVLSEEDSSNINNLGETSNLKKGIQGWMRESHFVAVVRDFIWSNSRWNNERLNQWLDNIQPKFVFLLAGNMSVFYDMAVVICSKFQIPLFLQITDDYFIYRNGWNPWKNLHRFRMSRRLGEAIKKCECSVVICDKMARIFKEKYGGKYFVCMNSVEVQDLQETGIRQAGKDIKLVYAGNLGINRWKVLKLIGQAIKELKQDGISAHLQIYSSCVPTKHICNKLTIPFVSEFRGSLYGEALEQVKKEADILVHVEAFEKRYCQLTYTAMSTKVPEYMGSGRTILAVGPGESASIEFLKENNVAMVVTERSKEAIKEQIKRFACGDEELVEMRRRAVRIAQERFSKGKNAEHIYKIISGVCEKYGEA